MLTVKPDRSAGQGRLAPVFNPFSLPSPPGGLEALPLEICGKREQFFGSVTSKG